MRAKPFSFVIFILLCCTILGAEDQKRNDSGEVTTQIATTADGRKVILMSDGTWEYYKEPVPVVETSPPAAPKETPAARETPPSVTAPKETPPVKETTTVQETHPVKETAPTVVTPAPPATPNQIQKSTLSFDAAVALQPGDSKPIAGSTFYLLDNDLNNILGSANLKLEKGLSLLNTFSMANYGSTLGVERSVKNFTKAMDAIKPHVVATTTSDANGKGQFSSLNPGTYYLMNTSIIFLNTGSLNDRKAILWNVKVQVQPGENSIRLDEKNIVP